MPILLSRLLAFGFSLAIQESGPEAKKPTTGSMEVRTVEWKEGVPIALRVPVAAREREFMTTVALPEESIETAITGWGESEITAIQKRGLLFLRLSRKAEGQLNVLGQSGRHYLFHIAGVENAGPGSFDTYVKIVEKSAPRAGDPLPKRQCRRPAGALELLQAMRLGLRFENSRILRAKGELAYESPFLEVRLAYVYDAQSYRGFIYDVRNRTAERQHVDASRFRGKDTALILTALKENLLESKAATRLYVVTWKE